MSNFTPYSYGVSTTGNVKALVASLSSVLLQLSPPSVIFIRSEGEYPITSEFYLEQLFALARIKDIEVSFHVGKSLGIRHARDWLIRNSPTELLWMGDDDVIYAPDCAGTLISSTLDPAVDPETLAYINGTKADVTNRRGYRDFSLKTFQSCDALDGAGYNFVWEGPNKVVKSPTADTGNLLINTRNVIKKGIRFEHFEHSTNCSGDDTLFALLCHRAGLLGYFATGAVAWHLEKPQVTSFNEFAARKNLVYQQAIAIGYAPNAAAKAVEQMLAWEKLSPRGEH